jgi:hypothetical protein
MRQTYASNLSDKIGPGAIIAGLYDVLWHESTDGAVVPQLNVNVPVLKPGPSLIALGERSPSTSSALRQPRPVPPYAKASFMSNLLLLGRVLEC